MGKGEQGGGEVQGGQAEVGVQDECVGVRDGWLRGNEVGRCGRVF